MRVVVSCEHGGRELPPRWRHLGAGYEAELASHRGWDPGALELAEAIAAACAAPLVAASTTRLLVELNRSPGHPRLFSELSRDLPAAERETLLREIYHPHRDRVLAAVEAAMAASAAPVLHLAVHSFTPVWEGVEREVDVGLLYDPRRRLERAFCATWRRQLRSVFPELRVRRNVPYRGAADGLTTALRRRFAAERYLGIELEISQRLPLTGGDAWQRFREGLPETLAATLATGLAATGDGG